MILLLLLFPVIYIGILCLVVRDSVRCRVVQSVSMCTYPFLYPFKVKYLTRNYFFEENKGVIMFHPKPLEALPSCRELEETLNEDYIVKLDYARHNMMTDMLAHNYLSYVKD